MLKKLIFIFSLSPLTAYPQKARPTIFTDSRGNENVSNHGEQLYNYVQNGCSHLLGNQFIHIPTAQRKNLYAAIKNDIFFHLIATSESFNKEEVDHTIVTHIIDFIAKKTTERFNNNSVNMQESQAIYTSMKELLESKTYWASNYQEPYSLCKGFFESDLENYKMVENINEIKRQLYPQQYLSTHYHHTDDNEGFWSFFLSFFFKNTPTTESTPQSAPRDNQDNSERPPATNPEWQPQPSAPHADLLFPAQTPLYKKLFPSEECSAGCMSDFKEDGLERIFLPCGHDACTSCARNWFITQGNNTCPQCRYSLLNTEKQSLKVMLDQPYVHCSCCAAAHNLQTLHCNHKICTDCTVTWIASDQTEPFKSGCPRCGDFFSL